MPKAPVVFLLGTSTAGKSTICGELQKSGWNVYGVDEDLTNDEDRCEGLLTADSTLEFQKMKEFIKSGAFPKSSFHPFDRGTTGLLFAICDIDECLKHNPSLDEKVILTLKSLATKNPDFKEKAGFNFTAMQHRIFDRAIESSKKGEPIVIDGSDGMRERFEEYTKTQNHSCPTSVILIHLPVTELTKRMEARNLKAQETGDLTNQRNDLRPFEQYANFFGALQDTRNLTGEVLQKSDIITAVSKFGKSGDDIKLCEKLGFQEGQDLIAVGVRVKVDAVFDHAKMTTSEIADGIKDLSLQLIAESQKKDKVDKEEPQSFVEKLGLQKPDEKPRSFVETMQAGKYGKLKSPGGAREL